MPIIAACISGVKLQGWHRVIRVSNLTKRFGRKKAVDNISFEVAPGEVVGFLGPNGAGKTTTMRMLSCYLPPTCGEIMVAGHDASRESLEVRRRIGYLPENAPLYVDMRVLEYLRFRAAIRGLRGGHRRRQVEWVLHNCGLSEVRDRVIGHLSKGFRQRVGIADALVHEPELLILDEPTLGLDPNQIRQIRALIKGLARKHTVLLSSHILSEVESVCDRVLIMHEGKIAGQGTPAQLSALLRGHTRVTIEVRGPGEAVAAAFGMVPGVVSVSVEAAGEWTTAVCACEKGTDPRSGLFQAVLAGPWELRQMHEQRGTLEDQITGGGAP
jgi:ABC-2 type transport system ATP-binding protein